MSYMYICHICIYIYTYMTHTVEGFENIKNKLMCFYI